MGTRSSIEEDDEDDDEAAADAARPLPTAAERRAQRGKVQARKADPNQNDVFALAEVYEGAGLLVPVMDLYRDFFQTYPEENEMRPLLIKAYHDLKLMDLKEKEAITFNTIEMERQL